MRTCATSPPFELSPVLGSQPRPPGFSSSRCPAPCSSSIPFKADIPLGRGSSPRLPCTHPFVDSTFSTASTTAFVRFPKPSLVGVYFLSSTPPRFTFHETLVFHVPVSLLSVSPNRTLPSSESGPFLPPLPPAHPTLCLPGLPAAASARTRGASQTRLPGTHLPVASDPHPVLPLTSGPLLSARTSVSGVRPFPFVAPSPGSPSLWGTGQSDRFGRLLRRRRSSCPASESATPCALRGFSPPSSV